jgi:hypothetical protein
MLPWLGGLCLISWLGNFPEEAKGAGNLGLISFWWAWPVTFVFTAAIFWLAMQWRLSPERAVEHVTQQWVGEEDLAVGG